MSAPFYKIPLQLSSLLEGNELPSCNLNDSISKNLELIVMTKYGEHRSDPTYGCGIWDLDFEIIISQNLWEEKLRQSLVESISKHEPRLSNININVSITEIKKQHFFQQFPEVKKSVEIHIGGVIKKNGVDFSLRTNLFLSPLSKN
jgi:phage baseplate assembly protein W